MKIKKFNEAYGQERPSQELVNLLNDTFKKYGNMIMEDEDTKKLLEEFPDLKGIDNMRIGNYLVSIKIKKKSDEN